MTPYYPPPLSLYHLELKPQLVPGQWILGISATQSQKILPDRIIESSKLYPKVSQAVAHTLMTSLLEIFGLSDFLPTIVECVPQPSTLPKSSELPDLCGKPAP